MDQRAVRELLNQVAHGERSVDNALLTLRSLPFEDLAFATLDHHRGLRTSLPEVIYCEGKTPDQTAEIIARLVKRGPRLLATRASPSHYTTAQQRVPGLNYSELAPCILLDR